MAGGFTLLETVLVVAVVGILTAIATLNFRAYSLRYQSEAQTRLLYTELMRARLDAVYRGRGVRVKLYPSRFEVYSSTADDSQGVGAVARRELSFPIVCPAAPGSAATGYRLDFEPRGTASDEFCICLDPAGAGAVDSVKVSVTRLSIGKKGKGDACNADNITVK